MTSYFEKVKSYLLDLEYTITLENETEEVFVIENEGMGIRNLVLACADPILIMEQFLFEVNASDDKVFKNLLIDSCLTPAALEGVLAEGFDSLRPQRVVDRAREHWHALLEFEGQGNGCAAHNQLK